jgi:hypothetical protein
MTNPYGPGFSSFGWLSFGVKTILAENSKTRWRFFTGVRSSRRHQYGSIIYYIIWFAKLQEHIETR